MKTNSDHSQLEMLKSPLPLLLSMRVHVAFYSSVLKKRLFVRNFTAHCFTASLCELGLVIVDSTAYDHVLSRAALFLHQVSNLLCLL